MRDNCSFMFFPSPAHPFPLWIYPFLAWQGMEVTLSFNNHRNWPSKDFWWKVPVSFLLSSLHRPPPQGPSAVLRPILVDPSVLFWDRERKSLHVVRLARLRSMNILVFIIFCSWTFFSFLVLTPHCFPASVSTAPAQFLGPPCFPPWTLPLSAGRPGEHTLETKTKEDKDRDRGRQIQRLTNTGRGLPPLNSSIWSPKPWQSYFFIRQGVPKNALSERCWSHWLNHKKPATLVYGNEFLVVSY